MGSGEFLWVLVGSDREVREISEVRDLRSLLKFLKLTTLLNLFCGFHVSSCGFLRVSFVILNAVKNLSGCDKGCAIPEILRFAQDDRLE